MSAVRVPRVVFDTNTVVSAIHFTNGRLAWLRSHWASGACLPLASQATIAELNRVLAYAKFRLDAEEQLAALEDYLPFCEIVEVMRGCEVVCRDPLDQKFLDLAEGGAAEILVTWDADLLSLAGTTNFRIETPGAYRSRFESRRV